MKTNNKNTNSKKKSLLFGAIIIVLLVLLLVFFHSIKIIYQGFNVEREVHEIKYIYNVDNSVDYTVYMFPNSFFEEGYLGMDKQYTSKLVSNIDINYYSLLNVSRISNIDYDYTLKATLNGKYLDNNNFDNSDLWTKEYILMDKIYNFKNATSKNELKVPITINYNYFKNLANEFEKELRLDIDAVLNVELLINYRFYVAGDKVEKSQNINVKIPLSEATFEIEVEAPDEENEIIFIEKQKKFDNVKIISGFITLFGAVLGFISFIFIIKGENKKSEYVLRLNKVFKDYGNVIAETTNLPDFKKQIVLEIKEFMDLIDIEDELKIPIIYYEKRKNREGWFFITHNQQTYIYILKVVNSRKK